MTNHELQRRLARFDDWQPVTWGQGVLQFGFARNGVRIESKDLPNYSEDLNALRRIEMKLTEQQRREYVEIIDCNEQSLSGFGFLTVSPQRRAEALLIVLGK